MHTPMPPLNALRAFEAAARHLSLTRAAAELHVTAGALSHQIRALEELLGVQRPTLEPIRPEDAPGALLTPQSEDVEGPYNGPYEAGGVWAVLEGSGSVTANGREIAVTYPGAYELIAHARSPAGRSSKPVVRRGFLR